MNIVIYLKNLSFKFQALKNSSSLKKLNYYDNNCNYQQNVYESAGTVSDLSLIHI